MLEPAPVERGPRDVPNPSRICAVIVTYNIGLKLRRCVDGIKDQVGHVLIVDNGSDALTRSELNELAASNAITLILNERNEGVARAYNQAVRWTREHGFLWMLTLDHDSEATAGMVDGLVRGYAALEQAGTRNVAIMAANPFDRNSERYLYYPPREHGGLPIWDGEVISSGSLIWLGAFDIVGPFNEDLFIYFVDVDFCKRLVRAGFGAYICPDAIFLHEEGSKQRHRFLWIDTWYDHYNKEARYYITRNTVYVIRKLHMSRSDIRVLIRRLWEDHRNVLLFDKDRLRILRFSLRGLIDGLLCRVGPMRFDSSVR